MDCTVTLSILICGVSNCYLSLYLDIARLQSPGKMFLESLNVLKKSGNFLYAREWEPWGVDEERMRPGHWWRLVLDVSVIALTLLILEF